MAFWTYMLRCSDGRYYTGHTEDLNVRLAQHQEGYFRSCWTFTRRPVELAWCESFASRDEALTAERIVGGWSRAKKEALMRRDWKKVSYLSRPPKEREARFSTSLETNGAGENRQSGGEEDPIPPFVSSEVEKQGFAP